MASEEEKQTTAIYGSAGMAAAGMMPGARAKKKPNTSPEKKEKSKEKAAESGENVEAPAVEQVEHVEEVPAAMDFASRKAVVTGQSGAGEFGHELDKIFQRLGGVRLVALCDGNREALEDSKTSAAAARGYTRHSEMLEAESPDLVSLASSWTDGRYDQAKASLEAGAHVFSESPFTETLKEADELLELARERGLKIAVAHPMRCNPHLKRFHEEISTLLGEVLELNLFGKMDETAGGEDLLVQGMHLFDLARWFAGEPSYCTASISEDGVPAIAEDAREAEGKKLGLLLGDTIRADFMMDSGIRVSFLSDRRLANSVGPWGIEFVGTEGRMRLFAGETPTLSLLAQSAPGEANRIDEWTRWPSVAGDYHAPVDKFTGSAAANRLLVNDWIAAIEGDREPASSGANARQALEMVHGVWQAGVTMKRAYFPLVNRLHPLNEESL